MGDNKIGRPEENPFIKFLGKFRENLLKPTHIRVWNYCFLEPKTESEIIRELDLDHKTVKNILEELTRPVSGFKGKVDVYIINQIKNEEKEREFLIKWTKIEPDFRAKYYYYSNISSIIGVLLETIRLALNNEFKRSGKDELIIPFNPEAMKAIKILFKLRYIREIIHNSKLEGFFQSLFPITLQEKTIERIKE